MPNGPMMQNAQEIEYWNNQAGPRWVSFQQHIDRILGPLGAAGLASADVQRSEAVLDIGCGCGATLLELATAVGPDGSVVGVDVSRSMLAIAQQRALALGLTNARCMLADASTCAFGENVFDLAFSRFGVMFFDDPIGAFANVRRSLRPDGRLVFVCWRDLGANPWFAVPADAVRPHLPPQPQPDPEAPGPLAFADPDRVRRILERAGFDRVAYEPFDAKLRLGAGPAAIEFLSQIGPASRLLSGADDRARTNALSALEQSLRAHEHEPGGDVVLGAGVWIISAHPAMRR